MTLKVRGSNPLALPKEEPKRRVVMGEALCELINLIAQDPNWDRSEDRVLTLARLAQVLSLFEVGSWRELNCLLLKGKLQCTKNLTE